MRDEFGDLVFGHAHVVIVDESTTSPGGEDVFVPAHDTNPSLMSMHAAELGLLFHVPDLNLTGAKPHANVGTITAPLDTADVGVGRRLEQAAYGTCFCRPDVYVALEADGDLIAGAPIKEIQVVVVHETRSVEHTFGRGKHAAAEMSRGGGDWLEGSVVL